MKWGGPGPFGRHLDRLKKLFHLYGTLKSKHMKKVLRLVAYLIGLVVVVVVAFAAFVHFRGIPKYEADKVALTVKADSAMVAHGAKLASVQCLHCHRGSDGKVSGRPLSELPPDFGKVYSANITQSKTNGP